MLSACKETNVPPSIAEGLDGERMFFYNTHSPDNCEQVPLSPCETDVAVIYIGGFLDRSHGQMKRCFDALPQLSPSDQTETRAYYHWDGDEGNMFNHSTELLCKDIEAWAHQNAKSTLVLIGHSYGGSATMDVARHIAPNFHGKLIIATLDPVSRRARSQPRQRAARVDYWLNSYVAKRRACYELFIMMAGTWNYCEQADENFCFSCDDNDFTTARRHGHSNVLSLLIEKNEASGKSLWGQLTELLSKNKLR